MRSTTRSRAENFLTISRDIVAAFETKVAPEPCLGRRPLVVKPSTDGMPRANVGDSQYNVIVTCLGAPYDYGWFTQFAYQMGHELGHFWIGRHHSWFKESVCTALSFTAIDELAKQWKDCPSSPKFAEAADDMRDYHVRRRLQAHIDKVGLKDVDAAMAWAREKGPELLKVGAGSCTATRSL